MKQFENFQACNSCTKARQATGKEPVYWIHASIQWLTKEQSTKNNEIIKEICMYQMNGDKARRRPQYAGVDMCWECYGFLHGVRRSVILSMKKRAENQVASGIEDSPIRDAVTKFIKNLQETLGEADPTHKGFFQLPADTKANHYIDFATAEAHQGCHCV